MGRSPPRRGQVGRRPRAPLGRTPARVPGHLMPGGVATGALSRGRHAQPRHRVQEPVATLRPVDPTAPAPLGRQARLGLRRPDQAPFPAPRHPSVPPGPVPPGSPVTQRPPKARGPGGDRPAMLLAAPAVVGLPVVGLSVRVGAALRRPAVADRVPRTTGPAALLDLHRGLLNDPAGLTDPSDRLGVPRRAPPSVRAAMTTARPVMTAASARLRPGPATTGPLLLRGPRLGRATTGHPSGRRSDHAAPRPEPARRPTRSHAVPRRAATPGPPSLAGVVLPRSTAGRRGRPSPSCRPVWTPQSSTTTCCAS
jgi:hypothetical protein